MIILGILYFRNSIIFVIISVLVTLVLHRIIQHQMTKGYITIKSASEVLGISVETLRNWDHIGKLKARRDRNGYRMYMISELETFAKAQGLKRPNKRLRLEN